MDHDENRVLVVPDCLYEIVLHMMNYKSWFETGTRQVDGSCQTPHEWQLKLAESDHCTSRLIRIPTGLGKTAGVMLAWAYHRLKLNSDAWPRRLVWCLPMRTLVEQTYHEARKILRNLSIENKVSVNVLMGGIDQANWHFLPEAPAVIVGTQDMLLSRALNRGYSSSRSRWPIDFGLLNQDALWVMDEVQLMDVGLATSAQLQAFRDFDRQRALRTCWTWWMSATLQPEWLKTVDTLPFHDEWARGACTIPATNRNGTLWGIEKQCSSQSIDARKTGEFVSCIEKAHSENEGGENGRITLVVCNTVERAIDTYNGLLKKQSATAIELAHSRFRPAERESWRERFLNRDACSKEVDRIIVATQVVEAGVDISASCLVTELAPWSSLIQRFGRCARYGGDGHVIVVDRGRDEKMSLPYSVDDLESAWNAIQSLQDVGVRRIEEYEESLSVDARKTLYPYSPSNLILRSEFDELFDTTADLTGADIDIGRYIRSGDERDLQVFWLNVDKQQTPPKDYQADSRELCSVPFLKARDWLCGAETKTSRKPKLKPKMRAWIWDWIDGVWRSPKREELLPGRIICVDSTCGGYRITTGFDPDSREFVSPIVETRSAIEPVDQSDNEQSNDALSVCDGWKTIRCHSAEVANESSKIAEAIGLSEELRRVLMHVATWHDFGKAHPAFQGLLMHVDRPNRLDLAKGPRGAWLKPPAVFEYSTRESSAVSKGHGQGSVSKDKAVKLSSGSNKQTDSRPGFRHELASTLAIFALFEKYAPTHPAVIGDYEGGGENRGFPSVSSVGKEVRDGIPDSVLSLLECTPEQFDLITYLVASHHGKVRCALHPSPEDQYYKDRDERGLPIRGVREDDELPSISIDDSDKLLPSLTLTLEPARLGLSPRTGASWRERTTRLIEKFSPTTLAYVEAVFRAADVRASKMKTPDQSLQTESKV